MVERYSALLVISCFVLVCPSSHAFESLRGPMFANSSSIEVNVAVTSDGKTTELLHAFPAHQLVAMPRELRVQSIAVFAGQQRYELSEREFAAQSDGLPQRRQLWVFDGARLCILNISQMKSKPPTPPVCGNARVSP